MKKITPYVLWGAYKITMSRSAEVLIYALLSGCRYMLRYLKAVQMMKKILIENNLTVMATIARYACAYEAIAKADWWNKSRRYVSINTFTP